MIELAYLDYKENRDLDLRLTQYVNENLEDIIHFALDEIDISGDIEYFSPLRLAMQFRDECLLRIRELWQFSQDRILHKNLSPVYQYHLFRMIEWYIAILSETEEGPIPYDAPITVYEMDSDLQEQAIAIYGDSAIRRFSDVKSYLGEFFDDWDFLPEFLASAVQMYYDNSLLFHAMTSVEELEKYVELMDGDTYRKYEAICANKRAEDSQQKQLQSTFDNDLKKALRLIQNNPQYWGLLENEINDRLCGLLRMKYHVDDQSRQGESSTKKSVGEVDFLVMNIEEPIAIMEALVLPCLDKTEIHNHIEKLLVNYDPQGYPRACLIMYVTQKDFGMFWNNFTAYITDYVFPYSVDTGFIEGKSNFTESRHGYMILKRSEQPVLLSFHAIHLRERINNE